MTFLYEAQLEIATVDYYRELGYEYLHGAYTALAAPLEEFEHRMGGSQPERCYKLVAGIIEL